MIGVVGAAWTQGITSISLCTLIVLVQVVIYPQFSHVDPESLKAYASAHARRIAYVVIPLMLTEVASLALLWTFPTVRTEALYCATFLLALVWLLTFIKIVPIHHALCEFGSPNAAKKLVPLNAYRTGLWVLKTLAIAIWLAEHHPIVCGLPLT